MKKYFLFLIVFFLLFSIQPFNPKNNQDSEILDKGIKSNSKKYSTKEMYNNQNSNFNNIDEIIQITPEDFKDEESFSEKNIERALCLFNCYKPLYKKDGWEYNNSFQNASKIGVFLDSNVMSSWTGTLHDESKDEADVDYYHIKLNYDRQIRIELQNIPSGTDYDLSLYKMKRNTFTENEYILMGESRRSSNQNELIQTNTIMEVGEYIIKVESYSGLSSSEYTILTHAGIPNRSVSFINNGEANIVSWKRNFPQSKVYIKNLFEVYYVPYEIVYELSRISQHSEQELAVLLETYLGVKTKDGYQQFMEDSVGIVVGALLSSLFGTQGYAISLIRGMISGLMLDEIFDFFTKKLNEQRLDGLNQVINQALANKVGISYEIFHNCGLGSNNGKYHDCKNAHIAYETEFSIFRSRNVYSEYRLNTEPNRYPTMDSLRDVYGEIKAWKID